jgi:hypothetical protein
VSDRVVLGARDSRAMVGFQWTGMEPAGLDDLAMAEALGAFFEGHEMVTYDLTAFCHAFEHFGDEYLTDPD